MAKQIGEETKVTLDLKTLGLIGAGVFSLAAVSYTHLTLPTILLV